MLDEIPTQVSKSHFTQSDAKIIGLVKGFEQNNFSISLLKSNHVCAGFERLYLDSYSVNERRDKIDRIPQIFNLQFSFFISGLAGLGRSAIAS